MNKEKKSLGGEHSSDAEARHYTHLKSGILAPQNYKRLAGGLNEEYEEYSDNLAIATPLLYESSRFKGAMVI